LTCETRWLGARLFRASKPFVYRTSVMFARGFLTLFLVGVGLGTWVLVRDWASLNLTNQRYGAVLMTLMWLGGVPAWYWFAFKQPTVRLSALGSGRLELVRGTLLRSEVETLTVSDVEGVQLSEGRDGDSYFTGVLVLKRETKRVPFVEGRDRGRVLEAISAVRDALGLATLSG
jgi:hypothetical protein